MKTPIELGKKVKDIEINQKSYRWMVFSMLISFNVLLIAGLVFLSVSIPKWYIFLIVGCVWVACIAESVRVFIKSKTAFKYELYEKYLLVQTLYSKFIIKLENVFMVTSKQLLADRFSKEKTNTLVLKVKDSVRNEIKLPFISEDEKMLTQTIMQLAINSR